MDKAAANEGKAAKGSFGDGEAMTDLFARPNAALPGLMSALRSKDSLAAGANLAEEGSAAGAGDHTSPLLLPNTSDGAWGAAGDLRSTSSINMLSTADAGYSRAVTMGVSSSSNTASQNASLRAEASSWGSRESGVGLCERCNPAVVGGLKDCFSGEAKDGVKAAGREGAAAAAGLLGRRGAVLSLSERDLFRGSAAVSGVRSDSSGAEGYGERG